MKRAIVPFALATFLLFTSWPGMSGGVQIAYFLVVNIGFWLAYTCTDIPYMVLGGEIVKQEEERLGLRGFATAFYYIGYLMVTAGTLLMIEKFSAWFGIPDLKSWSIVGALFGIVILVSYGISIISTKGKEPPIEEFADEKHNVSLVKSAFSALSVRPYLCVVIYIFVWNIACAMFTAAQPYMMTHYLEMSTGAISLVYTIYVFMVLVCTPLVSRFAQKTGPKTAMLVVLGISTLACLLFRFIPYTVPILYVHNFTIALTIVGWSVLAYAMVYDISEVAHLKTKVDNRGMYLSLFQFAIKLSGAVGTWLLGMLLAHYQYDAAAETISDYTLTGIQNIYTIFPAIFIFLSMVAIWRYSLTSANINKLKELVKRQDSGETVDEAEYKGLL